jgi:serine/threonine-protein kinase
MAQAATLGDLASLAGQRLGRYEILTQLASGGMATVYIARAQGVAGFERLVAIKVMHPHLAHEEEFIQMFLDEARLAARIRHPNVVPTLDISDTDGRGFYLVMDYVEGDHLGALLRGAVTRKERLDPRVAVRVVLDALAGLAAAHTLTGSDGKPLNLVHRDISPHNILVGADGVSRLTDFGVAKAEVRLSSTRDGQFKGKLGYMAPEHASTGLADQRSDIFSMGIVLWECLASKRLFRGENNAATLSKILNMPVPHLGEISSELAPFDDVLQRALARPPEERFQSADAFIEALEGACTSGGTMPAGPRQVAAAVMNYAGEKVDGEKARIQEAIATYGASSLTETPLPRPSDGSSSKTYRKDGVDQGQDVVTMAARPAAVSGAQTPVEGKKRGWLLPAAIVGALLIIGGAIAVAFVLMDQADDPPAAEQPTFTVIEGNEAETTEAQAEPEPDPAPPPLDEIAPEHEEATAEEGNEAEEETTGDESEEVAAAPTMRRRGRGMRGSAMRRGQEMGMAGGMEASAMGGMSSGADLIANPYTQ